MLLVLGLKKLHLHWVGGTNLLTIGEEPENRTRWLCVSYGVEPRWEGDVPLDSGDFFLKDAIF
jgi:hypothetical protein